MQLHDLKPTKSKSKKRVGRGGKRGTYSGRGMKGQKSRAGHKKAPVVRELLKKYHKLRGYKFNSINEKPAIVNVSDIEKLFNSGDVITPEALLEKNLIRKSSGSLPKVKVLGNGNITKKVTLKECISSKQAAQKIESAGGSVK
ncbi:MAG: 50S ribosomal protein L15 [Parcubacteria group bacterium ADurb.Bin247]|nr:MAG: 50S ribosomal protein L15 [Parcubacteria group bacterium ADurb.Bin247]